MKSKKIKSVLVLLLITLFTVNFIPSNKVQAKNSDAISAINEMVASVNQNNWDTFINLMYSTEQEYFRNYFSYDTYDKGIKQVKSMSLESIDFVDSYLAKGDLLVNEYPILEESNNVEIYLVGLNCEVTKENQYFYNGLNYFNITLVRENGEMKIVQFNKPSYTMASEVLDIDIKDQEYTEESAALNTIKAADEGHLINIEGEDIYQITASNNYSDHPQLGNYTNYPAPDTIIVLNNKVNPNNPAAVEYSFDYYIRNTLPNEVILSTFGKESLKANAYCVKGVGWYRIIKPVSPAGGYDVTQYTQAFWAGTAHSISDKIFDEIEGKFVVNSSSKIFFPEYGQGDVGVIGTARSGRLLQYGSKKLEENGKTYLQILNYYYSGSDCSSGDVKIVTVN